MMNDTGQPVNVPNLLLSFFKSIDGGDSDSISVICKQICKQWTQWNSVYQKHNNIIGWENNI